MPVVQNANKIIELAQASDPKAALIKAAGDMSGYKIRADLVTVAIYFRPEKTSGGIIRPVDNVKEDQWQGKVGLILKCGPDARGLEPELKVYDWVQFTVADTMQFAWRGLPCRNIPYERIIAILDAPEDVF